MVTLKIDGVDCYYGSTKILEGIAFSIKGGDFVGVLGPNGSGKTTLLRAVSRTLKPRRGAVLLNDVDVYAMKGTDVAKALAVVPQTSTVTFDFTALEIVLMGRSPHLGRLKFEGERDLAVAREAMELTDTWRLAEKQVNQLSGGERQRVILARALAQEPKVLLLDEPMTHLDVSHQIEIMDLLRRLAKEKGLVVLVVFHDLNLAAKYCDSAILLAGGKIFSIGLVKDVLTAENIQKVFGVNVLVRAHPTTGSLYVIPISTSKPKVRQCRELAVHLICGGGSGVFLMSSLVEQGFNVTVGVVNLLDSDCEAATALGVPVVSEAPFSPITESTYAANLELIRKADVLVVTDVPFGYANLKNLEAARWALEQGITTLFIEETPINRKDFTKGEAGELWQKLRKEGATFVASVGEVLSFLNKVDEESKTAGRRG